MKKKKVEEPISKKERIFFLMCTFMFIAFFLFYIVEITFDEYILKTAPNGFIASTIIFLMVCLVGIFSLVLAVIIYGNFLKAIDTLRVFNREWVASA